MIVDWEQELAYALWLHHIKGIGDKTCIQLIHTFQSAKAVYEAEEEQLRTVLTEKQEKLVREEKSKGMSKLFQKVEEKKISFIPFYHPKYPEKLKEIGDKPFGLYIKGHLPSEKMRSVAIVGARDCTGYGEYVAEHFAKELSQNGIQIISGMARGIDGIAGKNALQGEGGSFAVLGCGVDICYPSSHKKLYEELCERGGVISSYTPGTQPTAGLFPPRNRIISGLSDVVLVIEARQKSGTLITVDMALEQGREVYVIPGRITDRLSDGCNNLLLQGAGIALTPAQLIRDLSETIWSEYQVKIKKNGSVNKEKKDEILKENVRNENILSEEEGQLYNLMDLQLMTVEQVYGKAMQDETLKYIGLPGMIAMLTNLCMKGYLRCEGGYYKRA